MRSSADHILTSHAGSLPRPDELIAVNRAREAGESSNGQMFQQTLRKAVDDVVRRQREIGVDVPGDGEFGKSVGHRVNYGAWWNYAFQRLGGLDLGGPSLDHMTHARPAPAKSC
jgi:5-methyltetrahydropteroyltriglutamate--homocysteine methyltransferase